MAGFDKGALERLEALGRRRGHLTTGDLEGELPVSGMTPEDIALVIVHLEERGIPVEVDPELLTGERRPTAASPEPGLLLPDPAPGPFPVVGSAQAAGLAPMPGATAEPGGARGGWGSTHTAVAVAGLVVVALLAVALLLLRSA